MQHKVSQAVGRGASLLGDRVAHYSEVVGAVGDVFRDRGEPQAAFLADTVAGKAGQMAGYLRTRDGEALWDDARSFARGHTWLMAGAGMLGGLLITQAVRLARASATQWPVQEYPK